MHKMLLLLLLPDAAAAQEENERAVLYFPSRRASYFFFFVFFIGFLFSFLCGWPFSRAPHVLQPTLPSLSVPSQSTFCRAPSLDHQR